MKTVKKKFPPQYWIVRWGGNVRGPYDKTDDLRQAAARAYGMSAPEMAFKALGTKVSVLRTTKGWHAMRAAIVDNKGWVNRDGEDIPEETIEKLPRDGEGWPRP